MGRKRKKKAKSPIELLIKAVLAISALILAIAQLIEALR